MEKTMEKIIVEITPTKVDGVDYITVNEFALAVKKTPSSVYYAAKNGKGMNKLKSITAFNQILIAVSEMDRLKHIIPVAVCKEVG